MLEIFEFFDFEVAVDLETTCSATKFLRNSDSENEKK